MASNKKQNPTTTVVPVKVTAAQTRRITETRELADQGRDYTAQARIKGASITWELHVAGAIGTDDSCKWSQGDYAKEIGFSSGNVTGLRRLGNVLRVGIDPTADAEVWGYLSSKVNAVQKHVDLDSPRLTKTALLKGIKAAKVPTGRGPSGQTQNPGDTDGGTEGNGADQGTKPDVKVATPQEVAAAMRKVFPSLPADEREALLKALAKSHATALKSEAEAEERAA